MRPFSYKGRAYQRVESATSTMPQEMYNQYLIQRGGKYAWEAITNPDLKISDLDEHAVISAVRGILCLDTFTLSHELYEFFHLL